MKKYAIIVAGGSGSRMKGDVPKQFMLLAGLPVLMHTIRRFFEVDSQIEIIVVLPNDSIESWKASCLDYKFNIDHHVVIGGETRFHSVKNGLDLVSEKSIVAVHDGARPFSSVSLIKRCYAEAEQLGNAVPAISIGESMRKLEGNRSAIADRDEFVLIQTPQCFDSELLKKAYEILYQPDFTDDATVVENSGKAIHLLKGERENIKITFPTDMIIGEAILKKYFSES